MNKQRWLILLVPGLFALICLFLSCLLIVYEPISRRLEPLRVGFLRALNPPEEMVFVPEEDSAAELLEAGAAVTLTRTAFLPQPTASIPFTPTYFPPVHTPRPSATALPSPTQVPQRVLLDGIRHEYQNFNNCGPANLSMALSYWGWEGDQNVARAYLRPSYELDDKNVNPFEMVDFVEAHTPYRAVWRVGGDLALVKRCLAAGFPLLLAFGMDPEDDSWLGHYRTVTGYDDATQQLFVHDSYTGRPQGDYVPYSEVEHYWRHFNHVLVLIYPPEREAEALAALGSHANPVYAYQRAAERAQVETSMLSGQDAFFAWFNLGASLLHLGDYAGAAGAYDSAYALYAELPSGQRPWRILWYVDGPLAAYYHTGRYQDVINLADLTLSGMNRPVLEEVLYWRGMARAALGDSNGAVEDLRRAYSLNPNATPAGEALRQLGVEP